MEQKPYVIGIIAKFVRDGATLEDASTASRTNPPALDDSSLIDLGIVETGDHNHEVEFREVMAPVGGGGQKQLYDKIPKSDKLTKTLTCEELSPFMMEILYGSNAALDNSSTNINIGEGKSYKVWLVVEYRDQDAVLFKTELLYGTLMINGSLQEGDEPKPPAEFTRLLSSANSVILADNS